MLQHVNSMCAIIFREISSAHLHLFRYARDVAILPVLYRSSDRQKRRVRRLRQRQ